MHSIPALHLTAAKPAAGELVVRPRGARGPSSPPLSPNRGAAAGGCLGVRLAAFAKAVRMSSPASAVRCSARFRRQSKGERLLRYAWVTTERVAAAFWGVYPCKRTFGG